MADIRAGSTIHHRPSGETWFVLGVTEDGSKACIAGWPPAVADTADMDLLDEGDGLTTQERAARYRLFGSAYVDRAKVAEHA